MKSTSIGIDIVDIDRFRKIAYKKKNIFYEKIFDKNEIDYCIKFKDPFPHYAGKFALKEAFLKAVKKIVPLNDIHTDHKKTGEPFIICPKIKSKEISVSIAHEKKMAVAVVIIIW